MMNVPYYYYEIARNVAKIIFPEGTRESSNENRTISFIFSSNELIIIHQNKICKLTSNTNVIKLNTNFAQFPKIPEKSFMSRQSKNNCARLSNPPLKSKMTFQILKPI